MDLGLLREVEIEVGLGGPRPQRGGARLRRESSAQRPWGPQMQFVPVL